MPHVKYFARHILYPMVGDGEWEDPRPSLSYLLAELESSNPQRISKKMGGLGSGEDGISLIPLGRDGEWENMAETILSYLLAELESSNRQRISKKTGDLGSGEDGISPIIALAKTHDPLH